MMNKTILCSLIVATTLVSGCDYFKNKKSEPVEEKVETSNWSCTDAKNIGQVEAYLKAEYLKQLDKQLRHSSYEADQELLKKITQNVKFKIKNVTTITDDPSTAKNLACSSDLVVQLPKGLQKRAENAYLEAPCEDCEGEEHASTLNLRDYLESGESNLTLGDDQLSGAYSYDITKTDKEGLTISAENQNAVIDGIVFVTVKAFNDPQTLRLMNGKLPIYIRSGQIKPATATQPFLAVWQPQQFEKIEGAEDFTNRLQKNMQALKKWAVKENIYCLRLYDADLPDFNVAVDLYGDRLHVQEYAPPKTIDPEKAKKRFNLALASIRAVTGLGRDAIFIKTRARQEGKTQYEKQSTASKRFIVQEGKAKFLINLTDYLDTGLFLDHRQMRLRIAAEAKGKHFLNLYSYTSTASVHAALGGAASTTSVDLSNTYLNWSKENFVLNGLTVDHADQQHQFFASDCFEWLKEGHEQYDLIFIDPPTFSNSKKFHGTFDVQRDHLSLLKRAMNRLTTEGTLYFSNNYRGFEMDDEILAFFDVEEITNETIGTDFKRNTKIHRAWKITHPKS